MNRILTAAAILWAGPALAADKPFFSLANTDFVVTLGFLVFIGVLLYFKVPQILAGQLDKRADGIRSELDEARSLREEAQTLLASYERKQKEVQEQADAIVAAARDEAARAAEAAKGDIARSVERRVAAAEEQIEQARANAVRDVRDRAIAVAVDASREVIASQMSDEASARLIDDAIGQVDAKLH